MGFGGIMRYKDIKIIVREENAELPIKDAYIVLVRFSDDSQVRIGPIPVDVLTSTDFREKLIARLKRSYNDLTVSRFYIEGDPGTNYPFDVLKRDEIADPDDVNAVPDFSDDDSETSDIGEIEPQDGDETSSDDDKQEFPVTGTRTISSAEAAEQYNSYADRVDKDRDNKHDETGEPVSRMNDEGKFVDAEGNILDIPANSVNLPSFDPSKFEPSDSGGSGGGGMTGEQEAEVPSIIEDLYNAMYGPGTDEGGIFAALRRVITPDHFIEVRKQYQNEYGDKLGERIKGEFQLEAVSGAPNLNAHLNELNAEMRRLGWELVRPKGVRIFNGLIWKKYSAPESE